MADKLLPGINFNSNPGFDDFAFLHEVYSQEIRDRSLIGVSPGIVDVTARPSSEPFGATRPLHVQVSPIDTLTIDVSPGYAITPSFQLIYIDTTVAGVELPEISSDKTYIVATEYKLVPSVATRVNRFGFPVEVRLERPKTAPRGGEASTLLQGITVADINDFNDITKFSTERKNDLLVIAVVSVSTDSVTGGLVLSVDLTTNTFDFNRPWFSTQDIEHRLRTGSGVVTDNNPHGMEFQDLSAAGLTFFQQLRDQGGVLAKDFGQRGYPGRLCTEIITLSRIERDITGTVTSPLGTTLLGGKYFVRLEKLPVRTGSLYYPEQPWRPIPYYWIQGTHVIVLGELEDPTLFGDGIIFEYFSVDALEIGPEPASGLQTITVKDPIENAEFIVTGGLALSVLSQTEVSLPPLAGPIKRNYTLLCTQQGNLILNPQPMLTSLLIANLIATPTQSVTRTPTGAEAVTLTVGLTRAVERQIIGATTLDLDLRIRLAGVNENGGPVQEDVVFRASQWRDQVAGATVEEPLQFITTINKFVRLDNVILTNTTSEPPNAGPEAQITIWANIDEAQVNKELALITSFFWEGTVGRGFIDQRVIGTTLETLKQREPRLPFEVPEFNASFYQEFMSVLLTPPITDPDNHSKRLAVEFDDDRFFSETWGNFSASAASGSITVLSIVLILPGMTIRLTQDRAITFVLGTPDPELGEVEIPITVAELRSNIITTINDPNFDSTWFATLDTGTANNPILLSRPSALPEGFIENERKVINFSASFTVGSFAVDINGATIGPVAFITNNDMTLTAITTAINLATPTTGVSAVYINGTGLAINLNGPSNGDDFTVTSLTSTGGAPVATVGGVTTPFSLSDPVGGTLPTGHLPQRYLSAQIPWQYLSRPILWPGTKLVGELAFSGDVALNISNGDQIEFNGFTLTAVGPGGGVCDPTRGLFMFNPLSLTETLDAIIDTINNPSFNNGTFAELSVGGTSILLTVGGDAAASLHLLGEAIPGTWLLTPFTAVGEVTGGQGLVKMVRPLVTIEYRYKLVSSSDTWSDYIPLTVVSDTAYKFAAPVGEAFYAIQLKMLGTKDRTNTFSLYQLSPEVSAVTTVALDTRLTAVETELFDARGLVVDVNARISTVVDSSGNLIQDPELLEAYDSTIVSSSSSLKGRLDRHEALTYWATGRSANTVTPTLMVPPGRENRLITGPKDGNGNSSFMSVSGTILKVGGTTGTPLILSYENYNYSYPYLFDIDFTGFGAGVFFVALDSGSSTPMGRLVTSGTATTIAPEGTATLVDTAKNFPALGVLVNNYVLRIPSIQVEGQDFYSPITAIPSSTSLTIAGKFPANILTSYAYQIYAPREQTIVPFGANTPTVGRMYLGQAIWNGVAFTAGSVRSYQYGDKFTSPIQAVNANPNYEIVFDHNLGFIPNHFMILYHSVSIGDVEPKVVQIGDEVVVKLSTTTITVRNRFADLLARNYAGVAQSTGYLQVLV